MKSAVKLFVLHVAFMLILIGCGGKGSSSSAFEEPSGTSSESSNTSQSSPESTPSLPKRLSNSIIVSPLRDLGMEKGESVCFRLKSYNNITESDFSKAICSQIKNDNRLTLIWNEASENVTGYYVFFGSNKKDSKQFLADIIQS